ncbi:MAG: glycosyltransferase family 4 protein, partial [Sphingobacteriia bacterium]|nr:glycosyltransferase family 4 protein [Sphingobacteriia bacterium]
MKIGLYNECFPPIMDGVSQVVENYAQLLTERNHNVAVITAKVPFYRYNYNYTILNVPSVPMLLRPPYRIGFPIQILPPFIPAIQFMPDIMHAHSPFTAGNIALQLAKKHHIPFIITFHSKFRQDFEHSIHYKPLVDWMIKEIMKIYDGADEVWIPQLSVLDIMREYGYKGQVEVV